MSRSEIGPKTFKSSVHRVFLDYSLPPQLPKRIKLNPEIESDLVLPSPLTNCCSICFHEVVDPVTIVFCQHAFCYKCLLRWFSIRSACPLCNCSDVRYVRSSSPDEFDEALFLWTPQVAGPTIDISFINRTSLHSAVRVHKSLLSKRKRS